MLSTDCSYCSLARKTGELYCSRHATNMADLQSGVFYIHERHFEECDWHITRLSLNFNLDSVQSYFVANREFRISPDKYLLINEGQSFKTLATGSEKQRMITVAFKVGLAEQICQTLTHSHHELLDHFNYSGVMSLGFFEQTYPMNQFLMHQLQIIISEREYVDGEKLQDDLERILTYIVLNQNDVHHRLLSIQKVKSSTRIEIYRRLQWAMEYLNNHFEEPITVDDLASQACLSSFHFKRLFKEFFGEAPYQYIRKLRLQKAKEFLKKGYPVNYVCKAVGWEDPSSFIRLFKKSLKVTPIQYQQAAD